jgi:alpha-beta hydrolase superfamily lysophospholipase
MDQEVKPPIAEWNTGSLLQGFCCLPNDPVAAVLVIHGFGEYAMRHAKTMRRWADAGIATYAYDQRGHGRSPGPRAIVARLDDLVDDALAMRERVVAMHPDLPLFLFGVSMGGVIATRSAQRRSDGLRGVVLLAPAFAAAENIPPFVQSVLRTIRKVAPNLPLTPLSFPALSRDPAVGEAYKVDPLTYHRGVPLCSGVEIVAGGAAALAAASGYGVPTLILQGDGDRIVFPIGATRFAEAAKNNRDLTLTVVPGGYHELFNDPGSEPLVDSTADWIVARAEAQNASR